MLITLFFWVTNYGLFFSYFCYFSKQLKELEEAQMLRGELTANQQLALLRSHDDLAQALEGAFFVQVA